MDLLFPKPFGKWLPIQCPRNTGLRELFSEYRILRAVFIRSASIRYKRKKSYWTSTIPLQEKIYASTLKLWKFSSQFKTRVVSTCVNYSYCYNKLYRSQ